MSNEKKHQFFEFNDAEKEKIKAIVIEWMKVLQDNQNEKGLRTDLVICAIANFTARVCTRTAQCSKSGINEAFMLESIVSFAMAALRNAGVDIDKQEEEFAKSAERFENEQKQNINEKQHETNRSKG